MARKIVVAANKGGVLKTSISVNMAGLLSEKGKVLIIDMDMQGNVAISFGMQPDEFEYSLYDVMVDGLPPDRAIKEVYENIDIIPANSDMQFADFDILTNLKQYNDVMYLLQEQIKYIEHNYDYIILDTPPSLSLIHQNALALADEVLIPFHPEPYSMRSLVMMLRSVKEFKQNKKPDLNILGIVPTLIDGRVTIHSEILQKARKFAAENNFYVFDTIIPRSIEYPNTIARDKLPLTLMKTKWFKDKRKAWKKPYYKLLEELEHGTRIK